MSNAHAQTLATLLVTIGGALLGSACIEAGSGPSEIPMCESHADCDQAAGEVCDVGVCWGGPPEGLAFAAMLVAPADRTDLPLTPISPLDIARDGTIAGLDFADAVTVRGRALLACPPVESTVPSYDCGPDSSIAATINIEGPPAFPGLPGVARTVVATAGVPMGQDSFRFLLPKSEDTVYRVRVVPTTDDVDGPSADALAPPRQFLVRANQDLVVDWTLGDPADLKSISGCVHNVVGDGSAYAGMQVIAFGRWNDDEPLVRASSRATTDKDGCFTVHVPIGMRDVFDISVQPAPGKVLPTIRLAGEPVPDPDSDGMEHVIAPLVMPTLPAPSTFRLPIEATGSGGGTERVPGASVRFETTFEPVEGEQRPIEINYVTEVVTTAADADEPGIAVVELVPGDDQNRNYTVHVMPPAGSQFHSAFGLSMEVGIGGAAQVLQAVSLGRRVAVAGTVIGPDGEPLAGAAVATSASVAFRIDAENGGASAILGRLQFPTATTGEDGRFLVWVDRNLIDIPASYDLDVRPPAISGAPSWTFQEYPVAEVADTVDLGALVLPLASFARGIARDRLGEPVSGAELHLYQVPSDHACADTTLLGDAGCEEVAHLRGIWAGDPDGLLEIVLPDP